MIRNGFRASPVDYPWALMSDSRTIGTWVGRESRAGARDLGTREAGGLYMIVASSRFLEFPLEILICGHPSSLLLVSRLLFYRVEALRDRRAQAGHPR